MPTLTEGVRQDPLAPLTTEAAVQDLLLYTARDHARFGTGWSIDDTCGAVGVGELALVWARSGVGKSTLFLNIIRNTPDVPTLVVNMEMSPRRQVEWLTSMTFDVSCPSRYIEEVIRTGDEDARYEELMSALVDMGIRYKNLHFITPSRPAVSDLAFVVDEIAADTGVRPERVFIDHLGLMKDATDYSGITRMSSQLHSWAMNEELALVVLQQTTRGTGDGGKNDGHVPVTMSSGTYGGEADADWVFGIYRPDRNPKFKKSRWDFDSPDQWIRAQSEYDRVRGIVVVQCIKNRVFGDTLEDGLELRYDAHTRRLEELSGFTR